jgi:hypothetical protein
MPDHFERFVAERESPRILLIPSRRSIGEVIEGLLMVWLTWTPDEPLSKRTRFLPHGNACRKSSGSRNAGRSER